MRRSILALPVAVALVAAPAVASAQACVGIPVAAAGNAVTAGIGFPEGGTSFGGEFRHNFQGPLSVGLSYGLTSYDDVDPKQHSLAGELSYELPGLSFSACPVAGVGYSRMSEGDFTMSMLSVPVGLGLGTRIELSQSAALVPHVVPQWLWMRATLDVAGEELSDDDSALGTLVGATVAMPRFYFGGRMMWTDQDNVDPVFSIIAGMPF